jgi:hypothetical protein
MTREEELSWCAGFFEGAGRIQIIRPTTSDAITLTISISKDSLAPLQEFQQRIGGGGIVPVTSPGRNFTYRWQQTGWGAGAILSSIIPWLTAKQEQVRLAIEFANTIDPARRKLGPEIIARREELAQSIQDLKRLAKEDRLHRSQQEGEHDCAQTRPSLQI